MKQLQLLSAIAALLIMTVTTVYSSMVSLDQPLIQSTERIASEWKQIDESQQKQIQNYLLGLGLSSTGTIHLIGIFDVDNRKVMQFQQFDLHGTRLVWSVLVDPATMSSRIIFDTRETRISDRFTPIAKR